MTADHILYTIATIFIILGVFLPYAQSSVGVDSEQNDLTTINDASKTQTVNPVTIGGIIFSVMKMTVFTFGDLPVWLDLTSFMAMRLVFWLIIIEKIPFT